MSSLYCFLPYIKKHLWHDCFNSCADSVLQVLQISYFFWCTQCPWCTPWRKNKNSKIQASVTAGLPLAFSHKHSLFLWTVQTSSCCLFICGGFLLVSFLNLCCTLTNDFVSIYHKTHCTLMLFLNIINSVQLRQWQPGRHWDIATLSEH